MLLIIQVSSVTVIKTSFCDCILPSKLTSCLRPEEKSCQRSSAKKDLAIELITNLKREKLMRYRLIKKACPQPTAVLT